MRYSIVIPIFNSSSSIEELIVSLNQYFINDYEVICVDDCSSDSSVDIIKSMSDDYPIKLVELSENSGQQMALFCGLVHASGEYVITMDDDLQHPLHLIDQMEDKMNQYDLVYAVPIEQHNQSYRSFGSKLTGMFFKRYYPELKGCKVSSFRMFKGSFTHKILDCPYTFVYISALLLRESPRVANISYKAILRPYGQSGYSLKSLIKLFVNLNIYYGSSLFKPLRKRRKYEKNYDCRGRSLPIKCH